MRRVVIMGPPGSGKSTLARGLAEASSLPVFHLDRLYWRAGWVEAPAEEFAAEVERLSALPRWIIEGNYTATLAPRLRRADTLVYLDVPSWLSTLRVAKRALLGWGRVRPELSPGCPERFDLAFFRFAATWNAQRRDRNLAVARAFAGRSIILRNPGRNAALRAILAAD